MFKHNPHIAESFWDAVLRKGGMPFAAAVNLPRRCDAGIDARVNVGIHVGS